MSAEEKLTYIKNTLRRLQEARARSMHYRKNAYQQVAELTQQMGEALDTIEDVVWKES